MLFGEDLQDLMRLQEHRRLVHGRIFLALPLHAPRQLEMLFEETIHGLPFGGSVVVALIGKVGIFHKVTQAIHSIDASHEREFNLGRVRGPVAPHEMSNIGLGAQSAAISVLLVM